MADIITTLHPENDENTNLYPNIKKENIPSKSINLNKVDDDLKSLLDSINELHPSGVNTSTNILAFTTNRGIWVGSDTGHWYYWNGTNYVDGGVFQATELPNKSVTLNKLSDNIISFINDKATVYKNLLDLTSVTLNARIEYNGNIVTDNSMYLSDYISVNYSDIIYINPNYVQYICFFDSGKNLLSSRQTTNGRVTATVNNVAYFRCYGLKENIYNDMVLLNSGYPSKYFAYNYNKIDNDVIPNIYEPDSILKAKNLLDLLDEYTEFRCYYSSGSKVSNSDYFESNFIVNDTDQPKQYKLVNSSASVYTVQVYDLSGTFLNNAEFQNRVFTCPANRKFRTALSMSDVFKVMIVERKLTTNGYLPYNTLDTNFINNDFKNKKCVMLGDSITWYDTHLQSGVSIKGYGTYLNKLGFASLSNKGVSGACIAYHSESQYVDISTTVDSVIFTDIDLVTIAGGINDYKYWDSPLGSLSTNTFDKTTFIGAYQYIIEKILNDNPKAKIVCFTPLKCTGYTSQNTLNLTLVDYVNAIKEVANYYSLPILDLYNESGFNVKTFNTLLYDGLHPNNDGYKRISNLLISNIKNI